MLDNTGDGARSMGMIHTLVNAIPSYEDVRSGQSSAPKGCINIDECFYELDNCLTGEICIDNPMPTGSDDKFFCFPETTTPPPPTISPTACFMAQRECDPDADCFNHPLQPGDVMCKCRAGLEGNGELVQDERGNKKRGCSDIDECKEGTHNCQSFENEFCNNLFGSFDCIFNERCSGPTKCHPLASCMPVGENDYTCACPEGYSGDGMGIRGCIDIDECDDGSNMCHPTAFCFNLMGSYECKCPDLTPIAIMEECPVPDTMCGNVADHYNLLPSIMETNCEKVDGGEKCSFVCADGNDKPSQEVFCDGRKFTFTDFQDTEIKCVPPPDTQCGNLLEMPFAPFILDSKLVFLCEERKKKGGFVEECTFRCVDDPAQKPLMLIDPSSLNPIHVATNPGPVDVCEVQVDKKGVETAHIIPGSISDFIKCVNPHVYTDCGMADDPALFQLGVGVSVKCEDNECAFICPEGEIPDIENAKCYVTKFNGKFDFTGPVNCVPKPDDTPCGDVLDNFKLESGASFDVLGGDKLVVTFSCPEGTIAADSLAICDGTQFNFPVGHPIRCVDI